MATQEAFRVAVEGRDFEALAESLAEDVVFHSPVLFKPFVGREVVTQVISFVEEILSDFVYTDEVRGESVVVLRFRARIEERELEGIDFLELDADGRVAKLTVFMRPMTALTAFSEAMGRKLQAAGAAP
jgi:hypothetical protein